MLTFLRRVRRYAGRRIAQLRPVHHDIEVVAGPRSEALLDALLAGSRANRLPFMTGGLIDERRSRIHFRERDGDRVGATIAAAVASSGAVVEFGPEGGPWRPVDRLAERWARERPLTFDLRVIEQTAATRSDRYRTYGVIEIDLWHVDARPFTSDQYAAGPRYNDVSTSLRWETLDTLMRASGDVGDTGVTDLGAWAGVPDLYAREFPIDVVYTWVDDKDPAWLAVKARHSPGPLPPVVPGAGAGARPDLKERYTNRDELKYSLRSLEMFAPFIRNVFLVTMGQIPAWLDTSHPQLTVVDHRDIYADPSALPTFNSSSIETQLHHIDGLAEHFIYVNDDVFLGALCSWSDFFHANGAAKFFVADHSIAAAEIADDGEEYLIADRNAIRLFEREFGVTVHRPMAHVPHTGRRSVLFELEDRFRDDFDACQRERFRSPRDLRPIAFMGHHYGFLTDRAVPGMIQHRYLPLWKPSIAAQFDQVLRRRACQTFCVNDVGVSPSRESDVNRLVNRFLNRYFPFPSRFERS